LHNILRRGCRTGKLTKKGGRMKKLLLCCLFLVLFCSTAHSYYFTGEIPTPSTGLKWYTYYIPETGTWYDNFETIGYWTDYFGNVITLNGDIGEPTTALTTMTIDVSIDWDVETSGNFVGKVDTNLNMDVKLFELTDSHHLGPEVFQFKNDGPVKSPNSIKC
jgi:hypothetical protein